MKIPRKYYLTDDVVYLARDLLGKYLFTDFGNGLTAGLITETEAYNGENDRASHAYGGLFSERTKVMYEEGGIAYVYLCYGIHSLFNIVTGRRGTPHAVLVRGIYPVRGSVLMAERTGKSKVGHMQTNGPGKLSKALGIHFSHTGTDLNGNTIWLEDRGYTAKIEDILVSERIGVDYAGEDAKLPYRFNLKNIKKSLIVS